MPRFLQSTTLFATALLVGCYLSCASPAFGQHHQISDCGPADGDSAVCLSCGTGACPGGMCSKPQLNCRTPQGGQPELFYNYYVPGTCGGAAAQMYVAPRPVPPLVGQTYFTYQPFMPHELLYEHHRTYYRYYDNGRGFTRTHISWYRPPVRDTLGSVYNTFRLAR